MSTVKVVCLDYNDLVAGKDLSSEIEEAYGYSGLGLLTVKNVPNLKKFREELLPQARDFAALPENVKLKYEHAESQYSYGWSHGKENLGGKPDFSKGSFYNNPQYDRPYDDPAYIDKYKSCAHPNIWPSEMPQLQISFKNLGGLICEVGALVAEQCDKLISKKSPGYKSNQLQNVVRGSRSCKARLLHYFPQETSVDAASWCTIHNDHSCITGLTSAMYFDAKGQIPPPDPQAGLYIVTRGGETIKATYPSDHLAFQIGETSQIISGGILQATPHFVRASAVPNVSRETFAVFMQPNVEHIMQLPADRSLEQMQTTESAKKLPAGVRAIGQRFKQNQTFFDFTCNTLDGYYGAADEKARL